MENLAFLDVEDRVSHIPLREDDLFLGKGHDFPALANGGEEVLWIEVTFFRSRRGRCHRLLLLPGNYTLKYCVRTVITEDGHSCS